MSDIERETEEEILLHHFSHEHPLTLIEVRDRILCTGCFSSIPSGERAYRCSKKCGRDILHEECAEMPERIRHSEHPQHTLMQSYSGEHFLSQCGVCEESLLGNISYTCVSTSCDFKTHLRCVSGVFSAADDEEEEAEKHRLKHPSHPDHQLRLLRRSRSSCSFTCDACGQMEKGNSYVCTAACRLMIHERCAFLPDTVERKDLHHHPLSLTFWLPREYAIFRYNCDICRKGLQLKHWAYHCPLCRYVVHIKCAINTSPATTSIHKANAADDEDVIQFPINDVSEELIRPFVRREKGAIPHADEIIKHRYWFKYHHHQLKLISSTSQEQEEEVEEEYDEIDPYRRSKTICDGCTTPIYQKKQSSSSSSSSHNDNYYLSCGECKYFLHWACFHLPPELPSLPLHRSGHTLILKTCPKSNLSMISCSICTLLTNGLFYCCTECSFKVDIKCASLPNTIKYVAHPRHNLKLVTITRLGDQCGACLLGITYGPAYKCNSCGGLCLDCRCVLLPPVIEHRWDRHPLPLTYNANLDHPGEFYCELCELKMNPKEWMYHCRECDRSFHRHCIPTASGHYGNMKFGQQYVIAACHPDDHPLTYQAITTKRRCDLCDSSVYGCGGFRCAVCNFVVCFFRCGYKHRKAIQTVD